MDKKLSMDRRHFITGIVELTAAEGVESRINTLPLPEYDQEETEYFTEGAYPVGHAVGPGDANGPAIDAPTAKIQAEGGEFYYATAGAALIQDDGVGGSPDAASSPCPDDRVHLPRAPASSLLACQ